MSTGRTPATNQNIDETVPLWPCLLCAEPLVLMAITFLSLAPGFFFAALIDGTVRLSKHPA